MTEHKTSNTKFALLITSILFVLSFFNLQNSFAEEFEPEDFDIPESWQGTAVSVRFSDNDAVQDFDGDIPSYSGNETFGVAIPCGLSAVWKPAFWVPAMVW